jgi:hypothetical protein
MFIDHIFKDNRKVSLVTIVFPKSMLLAVLLSVCSRACRKLPTAMTSENAVLTPLDVCFIPISSRVQFSVRLVSLMRRSGHTALFLFPFVDNAADAFDCPTMGTASGVPKSS